MLTPRIETCSAIRLAGLQATFISGLSSDTTAPETIGTLWGALHQRLEEIDARESGVFYGWSYHLPPAERSRPDELGYVAGVEVAADFVAPEGMITLDTHEGLYAVFEHRGLMPGFADTLRAIYEDWLPGSGFVGNGQGDLEVYGSRWHHDREDSVFDYRVGIDRRV